MCIYQSRTIIEKKKILLIYPDEPKRRYGSYSKAGSFLQPLGVVYIASLLEENGYKVRIIDNSIMLWSMDKIVEETRDFNPDYIGLSSTTIMIPYIMKLAKELKKVMPDIPLVVGGAGITVEKDILFKTDIDFGIYGEGEYTFLELISALDEKKSYSNIKGLIIIAEKKINPPRPYLENLDELPLPSLNLLPMEKYSISPDRFFDSPVGTIISSRGCPYYCIFCDHTIFSRVYRGHSPERVVQEMKRLVDYFGVKHIAFEDDLFVYDKKRIIEICKLIKKKRLKVKWQCTARANLVDEELIKEMASAGCWMINIGVESGSQRILNLIKKGITIEQVKRAVRLMHKYKIKARGYFMINHPSETLEEMNASMDLALELPFHTIIVCITVPYKNTELWDIAKKYGKFKKDIDQMTEFSDNPNFITDGFTKEDILRLQKKFYIRFFFRPKQILKQVLWVLFLNPRQSFKIIKRYIEGGIIILKA